MIAATQADGVVDKAEQQQLLGQLDKLGVDAGERDNLARRLGTPVDAATLVKAATTPEIALQIYTASALAIGADTPRERQYLDNLAQSLQIEPGLKAKVEQAIGKGIARRTGSWSGRRESNPHVKLGKLAGYHYIMPASAEFVV